MKIKILQAIVIGVSLLISSGAQAEEINPYDMLEQVATKTFNRIKTEHSQIEANPELLRTVMEEELLPYVVSILELYQKKKFLSSSRCFVRT